MIACIIELEKGNSNIYDTYIFNFFVNVGIRANLCESRLILRALKLTTM
jgi:hypothetical protein